MDELQARPDFCKGWEIPQPQSLVEATSSFLDFVVVFVSIAEVKIRCVQWCQLPSCLLSDCVVKDIDLSSVQVELFSRQGVHNFWIVSICH